MKLSRSIACTGREARAYGPVLALRQVVAKHEFDALGEDVEKKEQGTSILVSGDPTPPPCRARRSDGPPRLDRVRSRESGVLSAGSDCCHIRVVADGLRNATITPAGSGRLFLLCALHRHGHPHP